MFPQAVRNALDLPRDLRAGAVLSLAEDQWFDRKSSRIRGRELADAVIALANAEGGVLILGAHGGRIEGTVPTSRLNEWRKCSVDHVVPPLAVEVVLVEVTDEAGNPAEIVTIEIEPSDAVHANNKDEVYLRVGADNRRLSFAQRNELVFDKGQSTYEVTPITDVSLEDLDGDLLGEVVRADGGEDPVRWLLARGLAARDAAFTVGAVLLFAREPAARFPQAHVRVIRYRGSDRSAGRRQQVIDDRSFGGPLSTQIEQARDAVVTLIPRRRALEPTGRFGEVEIVPHDAWLEGLVNAVTHRCYSMAGDHIRFEIFDDRVEVQSPGRFPGVVDLERPHEVSRFARNPRIARVLRDLNFGQELGEGIRRMFEEMQLAGLADPVFRQTSGSVQLILTAEPVDRVLESRLSGTGRDLVRAIRERQRARTGELVEVVGRSRPVVLRDLRVLRDAGVIDWVGSSPRDPRAYWRLHG